MYKDIGRRLTQGHNTSETPFGVWTSCHLLVSSLLQCVGLSSIRAEQLMWILKMVVVSTVYWAKYATLKKFFILGQQPHRSGLLLPMIYQNLKYINAPSHPTVHISWYTTSTSTQHIFTLPHTPRLSQGTRSRKTIQSKIILITDGAFWEVWRGQHNMRRPVWAFSFYATTFHSA